jgi:hypothetical protein
LILQPIKPNVGGRAPAPPLPDWPTGSQWINSVVTARPLPREGQIIELGSTRQQHAVRLRTALADGIPASQACWLHGSPAAHREHRGHL